MSYILDAIKKSEAERNRGLSPGALAAAPPTSRVTTVRIIAVVVTLNIAALAAWWTWQQVPTESAPAPRANTAAIEPSPVVPAPIAAADPRPTPVPAAVTAPAPAPPPASAPRTANAQAAAQAQEELPITIRPPPRAPEFSTHVYADDRDLRAVTLDGRRLIEGDVIEPGMRIMEITETGVIVDYHGERIEFDVLQDWRR